MNWSLVDDRGRVATTGVGPDMPGKSVAEILALQSWGLFTAVAGHPHSDLPNLPASPIAVASGGSFTVTAPEHTRLTVGEMSVDIDAAGQEVVTMNSDGEYPITIDPPFPFRRWTGVVQVT